MKMTRLPESGDEWREAILFAVAVPLLAFAAFLGPFQGIVWAGAPMSIPRWRIDIFFAYFEVELALPMLFCAGVLIVLIVVYLFIDRYRALLAFFFLIISFLCLLPVARAR